MKRSELPTLVLTRGVGESVLIGDDVTVYVKSITASKVRLAFQAPANIAIDREEIRRKKDYHFAEKQKKPPRHHDHDDDDGGNR